jgi:hypothetical protein
MADQLTTGQGSGTQATTGNPQTITPVNSSQTQTNSVQPNAGDNLLKSQGGISLNPTALQTIALGEASSQSQTVKTTPTTPSATKHHLDATYLVIPGLLIVLAIIAFWLTNRSVKNTTDY